MIFRNRTGLVRAACALLFLALGLSALSGCSPVPAQSVTLAPELRVPTGNVGKGKHLALKVVDARAGKVVGYRNADGSRSAPITVEGPLERVVGEASAKTLSELGFSPAPHKDGAPLELVITVKELHYSVQSMTVTRKVTTKCVLSAKAVNGPGHWEGSFPVSHEKEMVTAPDENANARLINDVLSESLNLMLSDPELVQFLGKEGLRSKTLKED
jgi:uncharacterized lipoprotein